MESGNEENQKGLTPPRRIGNLIELATVRDFPHWMPIDKCLQLLHEIFQMATTYSTDRNEDEKAFVLFLRFVSIAVEELPKHPFFPKFSPMEKHAIDVKTIEAIITAELLKTNLRKRYERESLAPNNETSAGIPAIANNTPTITVTQPSNTNLQSSQQITTAILNSSALKSPNVGSPQVRRTEQQPIQTEQPAPSIIDWGISGEQLSPYIRCQDAIHPITFQHVIIPNNLPELFVKFTGTDLFRFAFIYGRLARNSVIASHLLVSNAEEIAAGNFPRSLPVSASGGGASSADQRGGEEIPIVGCIANSLAHVFGTHFFQNSRIAEMICIICPSEPNKNFVLHLVNQSLGQQPPASAASTPGNKPPKTGRHPLWTECNHLQITDLLGISVANRNHSNPTSMAPMVIQNQNPAK